MSLEPTATPEAAMAWCMGLSARCRGGEVAVLAEAGAQLDAWYAAHPLVVQWRPGLDGLVVADPLPITSDELIVVGDDERSLVPWATLVRRLSVVTGGTGFHHGCTARDLTTLLEHPSMPRRLAVLALPDHFESDDDSERDQLVARLVIAPGLRALAHLCLTGANVVTPDHFDALSRAPWASTLRTLDLTDLMVDWTVDLEDAERHAVLRGLGRFTALTHLVLYNGLDGAGDLAVLLAHLAPTVTHLELGSLPVAADWLEVLSEAAPRTGLAHVSLGGGPSRTDPAWDRLRDGPVPVYLHGRRVDADYPAR